MINLNIRITGIIIKPHNLGGQCHCEDWETARINSPKVDHKVHCEGCIISWKDENKGCFMTLSQKKLCFNKWWFDILC